MSNTKQNGNNKFNNKISQKVIFHKNQKSQVDNTFDNIDEFNNDEYVELNNVQDYNMKTFFQNRHAKKSIVSEQKFNSCNKKKIFEAYQKKPKQQPLKIFQNGLRQSQDIYVSAFQSQQKEDIYSYKQQIAALNDKIIKLQHEKNQWQEKYHKIKNEFLNFVNRNKNSDPIEVDEIQKTENMKKTSFYNSQNISNNDCHESNKQSFNSQINNYNSENNKYGSFNTINSKINIYDQKIQFS